MLIQSTNKIERHAIMKLFAASYITQNIRTGEIAYNAVTMFAHSEEEAVGISIREAVNRNPLAEGWRSHQATAIQIRNDDIIRAYTELMGDTL